MKLEDISLQNGLQALAPCPACKCVQVCDVSRHTYFVEDKIGLRCCVCKHVWPEDRETDTEPVERDDSPWLITPEKKAAFEAALNSCCGACAPGFAILAERRELVRLSGGPSHNQIVGLTAGDKAVDVPDRRGGGYRYTDLGRTDGEGRRVFEISDESGAEHIRFTHSWRHGSAACDCGDPNCKAPTTISYRQWLEWKARNPCSVIAGATVERPGEEEEARINKEFARDMAEVARIRALPRDELNRPIEDGPDAKPIKFREFL